MAGDSEKSGLNKLDPVLGRAGVPLQSVTLATLVIGGWQARGYLEEQMRTMESLAQAVQELREDQTEAENAANERVKELQDALSGASERLEDLRKRIRANERCLDARRTNSRVECKS